MSVSSRLDGPTFSDAEYQRRWKAVADKLPEYGIDAICVTASHHVPYLAGYDDDGMWPSPVIIGPDANPVFVSREYDELTMRVESRIPEENLRFFFGDHDKIQVWADTLRELGLDKARLGLQLKTYGQAYADVVELQRLLPELQIVDATKLMAYVTAVKSEEELAVMRHAMVLAKIGLQAFYDSLAVGVTEIQVSENVRAALIAAGSDDHGTGAVVGQRTSLPHAGPTYNVMRQGDPAFIEFGGLWQGYCAGFCRSAVLGSNPEVEELHKLAEEAQQAALDAVKPGVTTGEVDRTYRAVVSGSPLGIVSHSRAGYTIGLDWMARGSISIHPYGEDVLEEGMTIHLPTILFRPGEYGVGLSDTILITKEGPEGLSGLSPALVHV
jgi:Xaa-Pro aminopeptidase